MLTHETVQMYKPASTAPSDDRRAIYVGNLPVSMTENALREIFSIVGRIHSTKLAGKSTLNAVNYAFVEYDDPASAAEALETFNGESVPFELTLMTML